MGIVYHAYDRQRDEEVALKTLHRLSPQTLLLFKQEFRALTDVVHRNLVSLYEMNVVDGTWFMTMELVRGCNFLDYIGGLGASTDVETVSSAARVGEGGPFASPARVARVLGSLVDLGRLRDATAQLVHGIEALHAAGKLHRDVKPSNVLVSLDGRVVLLDFGLVTDIGGDVPRDLPRSPLRGTLHYMAPELFAPERPAPTPAADWYSLGVMLYTGLTGTFPYLESWQGAGTRGAPTLRPPSSMLEGVPRFLDDLCVGLLRVQPEERFSGADVLARLGEARPREQPYLLRSTKGEALFVGRGDHLEQLRDALARSRAGRPAVVVVSGRSGMGKTTLVRSFLREVRSLDGSLVLEGRCYDRESVPYKAIDSLIDRLAEHLASLTPDALAALLPPDFGFLGEMFPVLRKAESMAPAHRERAAPEDLPDRRRRAFRALRELLRGLAANRPLVLFIDDVQWSDLDSGALLAELLGGDDAPALLLVASNRSGGDAAASDPPLRLLGHEIEIEHLSVEPLPPEEARRLAESLLARQGNESPSEAAEAIARDAGGHPLFIHELVRQSLLSDADGEGGGGGGAERPRAQPTLEEAIGARVDRLAPEARRLLDAIVVAGRPVRAPVVVGAAGVASQDREALALLRAAGFVVDWDSPDRRRLDVAHERIRHVVSERLAPEATRAVHEALARELERSADPDLEALFEHFLRAGIRGRAAELAGRAAEQAERALAFERAAELYLRAVELHRPDGERGDLLAAAARALANAGHAPEAAQRYLEAASAMERESVHGARPRTLRRQAAEQYLKNGDLSSGWRVMRQVLEELRIPIPRSHARALLYGTWRRVLFLLRGLSGKRGRPAALAEPARERLDVLWAVSTSFSMLNVILSDAFRGRHLLDALRNADASTVCRALAYEVAMETYVGSRFFDRHAQKVLEKVSALAAETADPYDQAWRHLALSCVSLTQGRFRETVEICQETERLFKEHCPGSYWERSTTFVFRTLALALMGELPELRRSQEEFLAEAKLRRTLFGVVECNSGEQILTHVAADRPEEALMAATSMLAAQTSGDPSWPENGYRAQQYYQFVATVHTELYRARPAAAWKAVEANWPGLKSSFLLSLKIFYTHLASLRGRTAVALAQATPPDRPGPGGSRGHLLRDARRMLARLRGDSYPAAAPFAFLLEAGIASVAGSPARARVALERAIPACDRADMAAYREVARHALSTLLPPGPDRDRHRDAADRWLRDRGVLRVDEFVAGLCPGIAPL
jgi:serine/threonine protein kinase